MNDVARFWKLIMLDDEGTVDKLGRETALEVYRRDEGIQGIAEVALDGVKGIGEQTAAEIFFKLGLLLLEDEQSRLCDL
jgi:5'-3' exonuclease